MTDLAPNQHSEPGAIPVAGRSDQGIDHSKPAARSRVLIVEDSAIVRTRLAEMIREVADIVGEAADGLQARDLFDALKPDCVVLDIQLPGISGIELLSGFKKARPDCLIMVLTTYGFPQLRARCASLGADHFFDKGREFERVVQVLRVHASSPQNQNPSPRS